MAEVEARRMLCPQLRTSSVKVRRSGGGALGSVRTRTLLPRLRDWLSLSWPLKTEAILFSHSCKALISLGMLVRDRCTCFATGVRDVAQGDGGSVGESLDETTSVALSGVWNGKGEDDVSDRRHLNCSAACTTCNGKGDGAVSDRRHRCKSPPICRTGVTCGVIFGVGVTCGVPCGEEPGGTISLVTVPSGAMPPPGSAVMEASAGTAASPGPGDVGGGRSGFVTSLTGVGAHGGVGTSSLGVLPDPVDELMDGSTPVILFMGAKVAAVGRVIGSKVAPGPGRSSAGAV
mmetsp:Transcript_55188/g.103635  ORF Transcript_55188/g.103635 Transcript_55188/m.103635 type:complete len:289 (-) Transcript_55188:1639-2505(-)